MRLTKEKLLALWRARHEYIKKDKNSYIVERYNSIRKLFDQILESSYSENQNIITINGTDVVFRNNTYPSMTYFSCKDDEMTQGGAFEGVKLQADNFPQKFHDIIIKIGCMLGGFDLKHNYWMREEFRIISNAITGHNDNSSLVSEGQTRHPSSHFADNNYFFNVINTIQKIKNDDFNPNESRIVLRWPNLAYYKNGDAEAEVLQKKTLMYRFPYKYFYMWTHDVLHPVSLMAYKNIIQQENEEMSYHLDKYINQSYDDFTKEWIKYSEVIRNIIPEVERGDNFWEEMSLLLSIISIQNQNIVNLKELLESGNKAIILFGPPGTGKTYHAEELVCQTLGIKKEVIDNYKFSPNRVSASEGAWTLVQFHPNYTYEDFIGGISPNLRGEELSYTLKEGVFKLLCDEASKNENEKKKFIIVIDEINRADLSSVFGELMYALEYRGRSISIPNFKEKFIIPKNVYIIGTMNSIDKSLVTFDIALRRRFAFFKVMPQVDVLETMLSYYNIEEACLNSFIIRCKELNELISKQDSRLQLGKEYQIGHAYFGKIKDFLSIRNVDQDAQLITSFDLERLWEYHICPLLEEYLGSRIEDDNVQQCLNEIMDNFTKQL